MEFAASGIYSFWKRVLRHESTRIRKPAGTVHDHLREQRFGGALSIWKSNLVVVFYTYCLGCGVAGVVGLGEGLVVWG